MPLPTTKNKWLSTRSNHRKTKLCGSTRAACSMELPSLLHVSVFFNSHGESRWNVSPTSPQHSCFKQLTVQSRTSRSWTRCRPMIEAAATPWNRRRSGQDTQAGRIFWCSRLGREKQRPTTQTRSTAPFPCLQSVWTQTLRADWPRVVTGGAGALQWGCDTTGTSTLTSSRWKTLSRGAILRGRDSLRW